MRRLFLFTIAVVVVARPLDAQIVVYDPANTVRNSISATIKEYLLETQREQGAKIRRMARRLSVFADLRRFVVLDTPRWRTHGGDFLYANGINDALRHLSAPGAVQEHHRFAVDFLCQSWKLSPYPFTVRSQVSSWATTPA